MTPIHASLQILAPPFKSWDLPLYLLQRWFTIGCDTAPRGVLKIYGSFLVIITNEMALLAFIEGGGRWPRMIERQRCKANHIPGAGVSNIPLDICTGEKPIYNHLSPEPNFILHINIKYFLHYFNIPYIFQECNYQVN